MIPLLQCFSTLREVESHSLLIRNVTMGLV
nr:MAG TPA: hypothetical protein [Caudoviricetes sp.]